MATASTGVFAGLGGDIIVSVDIAPDPAIVEAQLMEAAGNLEDTLKPMLAAKRIAQEDMQYHFSSESDPDGTHWIALNEDYLRYKLASGKPADILHRDGYLEKAAVSDEAFIVTPQGLFFNWAALPVDSKGRNIGQIHQAGNDEVQTIQVPTSLEAGAPTTELRLSLGVGTGHGLPARPFVGMSVAAEQKVWDVFDVWFDESVSVVINPKTGVAQYATSHGFGHRVVENPNFIENV